MGSNKVIYMEEEQYKTLICNNVRALVLQLNELHIKKDSIVYITRTDSNQIALIYEDNGE